MTGEILLLLFKDSRCFITPEKSLSLEQIDVIEPYADNELRPNISWTVRVAPFNKGDGTLRCFFMSIQQGETTFPPYSQEIQERLNNIERISFQHFDTANLLNTFIKPSPNFFRKEPAAFGPGEFEKLMKEPYPKHEKPPEKSTKRESFSISMKDVQFNNGSVTVKKKFGWSEKEIELTIANQFLIREFDAIKNYFAKALDANRIKVAASIDLEGNKVVAHKAQSAEIDSINDNLIEAVKINFTKSIINSTSEGSKNHYEAEEFIKKFGEENFDPKIFYPNEQSFLKELMKISDSKHYDQLDYLSSLHCHSIMKVRFIHKPLSFIFLLEGKHFNVLVWETLDTEEATYIWQISKDPGYLKEELVTLDEALTFIKEQGKTEYINSAPGNFHRVRHDYNGTPFSFEIWKNNLRWELNSLLGESN